MKHAASFEALGKSFTELNKYLNELRENVSYENSNDVLIEEKKGQLQLKMKESETTIEKAKKVFKSIGYCYPF